MCLRSVALFHTHTHTQIAGVIEDLTTQLNKLRETTMELEFLKDKSRRFSVTTREV